MTRRQPDISKASDAADWNELPDDWMALASEAQQTGEVRRRVSRGWEREYLCDWKESIRRDSTAQELGFRWDDRIGRYAQ